MKAIEKRRQRAYKVRDTPYNKAIKRANKEKTPLATLVEEFVIEYSRGYVQHWKNKSLKNVPSIGEIEGHKLPNAIKRH